jgi:hypothetical protein
LANFVLSIEKEKMKKGLSLFILFIINISGIIAQSNPDDYWLNNGFNDGDTVTTNSGYFYDDGGNDVYHENQDWTVRFCSENGNPITLDFSNFATHYGGPLPSGGEHALYDYMLVSYPPSADYVVYYNDTPEFSFTSQSTCINFGFHSDSDGDIDVDDLRLLTPDDVVDNILKPHYWDRWRADEIISQSVANILVDWVWGSGVHGIKKVQQALRLNDDGIVGRKTLAAVNKENPHDLFFIIKGLRIAFLYQICKSRPANKKFLNGWLNRLNNMEW